MRAADYFVLCEKCEGFVSCVKCWRKTERPDEQWTMGDLQRRKERLLLRDASRQHKLWPRLHEHSFDMNHADWTDSDNGHFGITNFQQLHRLRVEEQRFLAEKQQSTPKRKLAPATAISSSTTASVASVSSTPAAAVVRTSSAPATSSSSSTVSVVAASSRSTPFSAPAVLAVVTSCRRVENGAPVRNLFSRSLLTGTSRKSAPMTSSSNVTPSVQRSFLEQQHEEVENVPPQAAISKHRNPFALTKSIISTTTSRLSLFGRVTTVAAAAASSSSSSSSSRTIAAAETSVTRRPIAAAAAAVSPVPPTTSKLADVESAERTGEPFHPPTALLLELYKNHPIAHSSNLEVRASRHLPPQFHKPCELGVFAKTYITKGDKICYYAAHFEDKDKIQPGQRSHARHLAGTDCALNGLPTANLFRRYIPHSFQGVKTVERMPSSSFLPVEGSLEAKQLTGLPIGCMINSPAGRASDRRMAANPNVVIEHHDTGDAEGLQHASIHYLVAKFNIQAGDELLCVYNNNEEQLWKQQEV